MAKFKLVDNPFQKEKNAEHIGFNEIPLLFAEPPDYKKYLQPENTILIGSKGSGKSTVLKALSLPCQLKRNSLVNLPFYGIYIYVKNPELVHMIRLYEQYDDSATFEHFFSVKVAFELLAQFYESNLNNKHKILSTLSSLISEEYGLKIKEPDVNNVTDRLSEVIRIIRKNIVDDRIINNFSNQLNMEIFNLHKFITVIETINDKLFKKIGKQRVCLLVDRYEAYKSLGNILNIFLDQSLRETLIVKFAARYLPIDFGVDRLSRPIDFERDVNFLSLDHDYNSPEYEKFVRRVVNKIISQEGDEIDPNTIFSASPPLDIEKIIDKNKTPGENLRKLHEHEKGQNRNMREKLYYGFDCLVKLSGGNILHFLNLCEKAADNEISSKKDEKEHTIITSKSQYNACKFLSGLTFNKEVNTVAEEEFRELRSFIGCLGHECEKKGLTDTSFEGSKFTIPPNIDNAIKKVLRRGFLNRFLLCSSVDLIKININKDFIPANAMLHPLFAPYFGISWINKGCIPLTTDKIKNYMLFIRDDQPDYVPIYGQQKIPLPSNLVFISISIKENEKIIERNNFLKTTVNKIYKEDAKDRPRLVGISDEDICMTARDLWRRDPHLFAKDIKKIIKTAKYIVHDVTPIEYEIGRGKAEKQKRISTGVIFEMGLSLGYKRPFFLYHDSEHEPFEQKRLPKLLQGWDVRRWNRQEFGKKMGPKAWYREAIHKHVSSPQEIWHCPFEKDKPRCDFENELSQRAENAYISFQPRNKKQRDFLIKLLSEKYNIYEMPSSDYPTNDTVCQTCFAIRKCIVKVIDCTEGLPDYVLELGFSEAVDDPESLSSSSYSTVSSTIYMYDADLWDNPVIMSRASICSWHTNTYEKDIEDALEEPIKRLRLGGRK